MGLEDKIGRAISKALSAPAPETLLAGAAPTQIADPASLIDHTLLKPTATADQVRQLCAEAAEHRFAAVCVNPVWVALCAELLAGSGVQVCTVVGFPLGADLPEAKAFEAERCIALGATEIDMVINIGALKAQEYGVVRDDIAAVVSASHAVGARVKVIIETAYLTDAEKVAACVAAEDAGADFVKTSTGFGPAGATAADVALMRSVVSPAIGVKAAGGIRSAADFRAMAAAGANRIGASAGVKIMAELRGAV
jgi:deoxyribose-phosphate aldolase